MKIYTRQDRAVIDETEYQKKALDFLYKTIIGRIILKLVAARPYFSKISSIYQNKSASIKKIQPFIKKYSIDITSWENVEFASFNDFFIRKKEYISSQPENVLISPANGRLSIFDIGEDLSLMIKNSVYSVADILGDIKLAKEYTGGSCLIFRLAVSDYHRYVFFDNGKITRHYKIKGLLHTVRAISEKYKVYSQNCREVTVMETEHFGDVIEIEVGAMLVGKIINTHPIGDGFTRLSEKGYFEYGGSTIILLFKKKLKIDDDILHFSAQGIETLVDIGEGIGRL